MNRRKCGSSRLYASVLGRSRGRHAAHTTFIRTHSTATSSSPHTVTTRDVPLLHSHAHTVESVANIVQQDKTYHAAPATAPATTETATQPSASPSTRGSTATAQLLSMNQCQRALRRLPVGQTISLFHYNEVPSNLQSRIPHAARQQMREHGVREEMQDTNNGREGAVTAAGAGASAQPASTGDLKASLPTPVFNAARVLSLNEPQLAPSESTLFALHRRAVKERQSRCRLPNHTTHAAREYDKRSTGSNSSHLLLHQELANRLDSGVDSNPLRHVADLEEPCVLVPDTRASIMAIGLTTTHRRRKTAAESVSTRTGEGADASGSGDAARLDDFYLGLVTSHTDYTVDYEAVPQNYVLGVPTELLTPLPDEKTTIRDGSTDGEAAPWPPRVPVDISRWVVYDEASMQFLLRRHARTQPGRLAKVSSIQNKKNKEKLRSKETMQGSAAVDGTLQYLLEEQIFLAQTYNFDPKAAYDAAVALHTIQRAATPPHARHDVATRNCSYTLFFFRFGGAADRPYFALPQHAALLYPSCFHSYRTEVQTVQQLATQAASEHWGDATEGAGLAPSASRRSHFSVPLFIPITGKRYRVSSTAGVTAWTVQAESLQRHAAPATPRCVSRHQNTNRHHNVSSSAVTYVPCDNSDQRNGASVPFQTGKATPASPAHFRSQLRAAFREWHGDVTARGVQADSAARPPPVSRDEDGGRRTSGSEGAATLPTPAAEGASDDVGSSTTTATAAATPTLGDVLDAETAVLMRRDRTRERAAGRISAEMGDEDRTRKGMRERGWRTTSAPVAVAMPLVYDASMSLQRRRRTASFTHPSARGDGGQRIPAASAVADDGERRERVPLVSADDTTLAEDIWRALYLSELPSNTQVPTSNSPDHTRDSAAEKQRLRFSGICAAVLPLAEDRLATARHRVLLPFLCTPRHIVPSTCPLITSTTTVDAPMAISEPRPHHTPAEVRGATRVSPSSSSPVCCPVLWHRHEVEAVCGWRRYTAQLRRPFGPFSALLNDDSYIALGNGSFNDGHAGWRSPVLWMTDERFLARVLLPAMRVYAAQTCRLRSQHLYVYHGLPLQTANGHDTRSTRSEAPTAISPTAPHASSPLAPATASRGASDECITEGIPGLASHESSRGPRQPLQVTVTDTAVAVAAHHRLLSAALRRLQQTPAPVLLVWLGETRCSTRMSEELSERTGVPELCLAFFHGQACTLANTAKAGADETVPTLSTSNTADLADQRLKRLLSLSSKDICVVPVLDFLVWASLCSDFSPAACATLQRSAASVRACFTSADCVMVAKYCLLYPGALCVEGGDGTTVGLLRVV